MSKVEVSVVCLTYNHEKYVEKMLNSILCQKTTFNYEILIHDDASTDGTQDIIRNYQVMYPEIIKPILQKENQYSKGINPTRQYNYPRVKGKYVAYCEGDDFWSDQNKLQLQYDALERNENCTICVHGTECVSIDGKKLNRIFPPIDFEQGIITGTDYYDYELNKSSWIFQTSSYFVRTNVIKSFNSECFSIYPVGDLPLVLYALLKGDCYYLRQNMSCYRVDSGGAMSSLKNRKKGIEHQKKMIEGHRYFDVFSKYIYHENFEVAINKCNFAILLLEKQYRKLIKPPYKYLFKKSSFGRQMTIYLGCVFPELADYLERKKNGWSK